LLKPYQNIGFNFSGIPADLRLGLKCGLSLSYQVEFRLNSGGVKFFLCVVSSKFGGGVTLKKSSLPNDNFEEKK
jgi:hypothetical protein